MPGKIGSEIGCNLVSVEISQRAFYDEDDFRYMEAFARASRLGNLHGIDLPYVSSFHLRLDELPAVFLLAGPGSELICG
jgi:hypothetical protein